MTVRSSEISTDAQEAVASPAMRSDDPLSLFFPESPKTNGGPADSVVLRKDAMHGREPSAQFVTPNTNSANDRTTELVNHLKRALGALDVARDLTKAVDNRFAALKVLDRELKDRADAFESVKQQILVGTSQADDVVRLINSFEPRLADLREREQALSAVEIGLAACGERSQTLSADLENHVAVCEEREERLVEAVEQLGRRAADTIADLDRRVGDCEVRVHTTKETIAHLDDVSARTLTELQRRLEEADRKHQSIDQKITEAEQISASLTALEQRLPQVGQCDQALARIEVVVPQVERQLEDLNDGIARQASALAVNQHLLHQTLDEAQKSASVVGELENRVADLSRSHQQLDSVDQRVGQLEARAATAASEFQQAKRAQYDLEQEFAALQSQLRRTTETAQDDAKRLVEFTAEAKRSQDEQAQKASAVLSALETRMADVDSGHQLLDRVQQQLGLFEARAAAAATEVKQATGAKNDLEQEVAALQNQLQQMTKAADDEAKKLVDLKQQTERYQREETQKVSSVLSKLETRMADIGRSHQGLLAVDKHVGHLAQRAEAAAAALKQAKGAKNALQREIAELHDQLQRLTKAAQKEAKTLAELKQQAKGHRLDRASNTYADDRSIAHQLERRASRAWRSLTPDRLRGGGVAVALSVVVVVLVGIVGRFSRAENDTTANPPPPPLLASRALEFTPIEAVALWTPATIGGSNERLYDNRPASLQAPPPVRQVVVSETAVETSGNETAGVREASVGIAGNLPQFLGTLVIESEPAGATVFVNQQQVGVTPVLLKGLRARSYVVRVEREGYERWSTAVTVSTIHEAHVSATLQRDRGR